MFFHFINAVISLDLNWIASLFFSNIHWLFAFAALCYFFFGPKLKKIVVATLLLCFVAWSWVDFEILSGWGLFIASFLFLQYITKIGMMAFAEEIPQLKGKMVIVSEINFLVLFIVFNLFLR